MSRSICTVFVVLAIFQAAFACVPAHHKVINLGLINQTSPAVDLYEPDGITFAGDYVIGERTTKESVYVLDYDYENDKYYVMNLEVHMPLPKEKKIHYMSGRNKEGSNVAICGHLSNLNTYLAVVTLRIPPKSKCMIHFTFRAD